MVSNMLYSHPYLGKWSNWTNIFQMGWNHQLGLIVLFHRPKWLRLWFFNWIFLTLGRWSTFTCHYRVSLTWGESTETLPPLLPSGLLQVSKDWMSQRLFQHTCWNTPGATFTKSLKRDFFHNCLGGLPGVCSRGVLNEARILRFQDY